MTNPVIIGDATLYHGDCREILLGMPSTYAVISDPPYGIGYAHSGFRDGSIGNTRAANKRGSPLVAGDDKPFDPEHLLRFSHVLIWGANHFAARLPDRGRWLAWNKLGDLDPWDTFCDVEFAWHSKKGAARIFSMKWKGLACEKFGEDNGLRVHTTQKPIRLMRWCLDQAELPPDAVVLDPYLGSGTTGIAATQAGRKFIGIEIERKYFDIACERIDQAQRQSRLFA